MPPAADEHGHPSRPRALFAPRVGEWVDSLSKRNWRRIASRIDSLLEKRGQPEGTVGQPEGTVAFHCHELLEQLLENGGQPEGTVAFHCHEDLRFCVVYEAGRTRHRQWLRYYVASRERWLSYYVARRTVIFLTLTKRRLTLEAFIRASEAMQRAKDDGDDPRNVYHSRRTG